MLSAFVLFCFFVSSVSAATVYTNYTFLNRTLSSLAFSNLVRTDTVNSIAQILQSYTFVDLAVDSTNGVPASLLNQTIPMQVDVVSCINQLLNPASFPSDVSFHESVAACFYPLNDAHTRYVKPPPYSYSVFALPFHVEAVNATLNSPPTLIIRDVPALLSAYQAVYGNAPYTRSSNNSVLTLLQIDSKDAFSVLRAYADSSIGYTKDAYSRFNLAVHGYGDGNGYYFYRNQITFPRPPSSSITFTIQDVDAGGSTIIQDVAISWIGLYTPPNATFSSGLHAQVQGAIVGSQADSILAAHFDELSRGERVDEFQRQGSVERRWTTELDFIREHATMHSPLPSNSVSASSLSAVPTVCPSPSLNVSALSGKCYGNAYVAFIFQNTSTLCLGILRVFSFSPTSEPLFAFIVQSSLLAHSAYCASQNQPAELLIDLRANGGGIISLGYALLRFIFPALARPLSAPGPLSPVARAASNANLDQKSAALCYGRYDFRSSQVFQLLASTADSLSMSASGFSYVNCTSDNEDFFASCMWNDALLNTAWMDAGWMTKPRQFTRGGRTGQYSQPVRENCQPSFGLWPMVDAWQGYDSAHVTLLSDGLCGSTCAVFSSFVQTLGFGKTVVYSSFLSSAVNNAQQQFWSFPGGQVDTIDQVVAMLGKWNLTAAISPPYRLLPNSASIRFAIREIYAWPFTSDQMPLEYLFFPAHFHSTYSSSFLDDASIYSQVTRNVIPACVPGVTVVQCTVQNGLGVVPCVNGNLQSGRCMVVACNAGYSSSPQPAGSTVDAVCVPCAVGQWSEQNTVDFSRTSPLSTTCLPCANSPPQVAVAISDSDGVIESISCTTAYSTSAWPNTQCPYVTVCPSAQFSASGDDKKSAVVVLAVLLSLTGALAVALSWYVIRQHRLKNEKESLGLLGQNTAEPL